MKASETKEIIVGMAAVALFGAILIVSYGSRRVDAQSTAAEYQVDAVFNRVDGLEVGDDVRLSGVSVGNVDAMALQPDFRARVTLRLQSGLDLPTDTAAAIHTDGLFGSKFVVLDPGGAETMLGDGDTIIYTQDALIVSELLELIIAEGKAAREPAEPAETNR